MDAKGGLVALVVGEMPPSLVAAAEAEDWRLSWSREKTTQAPLYLVTDPKVALDNVTDASLSVTTFPCPKADIELPFDAGTERWRQLLRLARKHHNLKLQLTINERHLQRLTERHRQLMQIGIALSAEKDLHRLLHGVLTEARALASCEGASLFLVENEQEERWLRFVVSQNSDATINHQNRRFPLSPESIAGYAAQTGEVVLIDDIYALPEDRPYRFNEQFDQETGYRTRDMVTIPLRNHQDQVIGVLQLLNSMPGSSGFGGDVLEHLRVLASQAGVAIENSQLVQAIENLFEGFVLASVKAIEARDPVTSGHSFRVADYTCALAGAVLRHPKFRDLSWRPQQMRELRYASLLHDFGKVGVREHVLLKAEKLPKGRLEVLLLRIDWMMEHLQREFWQQQANDGQNIEQRRKLEARLEELEAWKKLLAQANRPSLLPQDVSHHLSHLAEVSVQAPWGDRLLDDEDFLRLSARQGSLSDAERKEIQSHVIHTLAYLKQIPWTPDLSNIPAIAGAHHEKLDGSGYPNGLSAEEIPLQSRMMTIADIFDALTARDRPYKAAVPVDKALDILASEAEGGLVDSDLFKIFIESDAYKATHPGAYGGKA